MDINKMINRVKNILLTPKSEWPIIADETTTVADIYKSWIIWLAAIPVVVGFIKGSLIGISMPDVPGVISGGTIRVPIVSGIIGAVLSYVLSLVSVYVAALITDALAPTFNGQKNQTQALKAVAYAWTAVWIAGIFQLLPWIGVLVFLVIACYSIYLLYLGLPATMKCPPEKAIGYALLSALCALVLIFVIRFVVGIIGVGVGIGAGALAGSAPAGGMNMVSSTHDGATFDKDSWLGKMEAAGKQMEAAQESGDADAQGKAMQAMMGAALGGGDQVESLAPDALKPFVPETLAGFKRANFSAERNGALGMQMSTASADYNDGGNRALRLEISDTGSMKGLMGLAGWAQTEKETEHGYERTHKQGGRLVHEEWDNESKHGKYGIVLGDRFLVEVSGDANSMEELKTAAASLDLAGLEALKNQGVKKN